MDQDFRIGSGVDIHRLEGGRPLQIGGISVPHTHGAVGHSDGDCLLHAIIDALLGAVSLGDIGTHFPDTNPKYFGIDSRILLGSALERITKAGFQVVNVDATVLLEAPKIQPYVSRMEGEVSRVLQIPTDRVSVKATTCEGLGFVGEGLAIQAYATALVRRIATATLGNSSQQ